MSLAVVAVSGRSGLQARSADEPKRFGQIRLNELMYTAEGIDQKLASLGGNVDTSRIGLGFVQEDTSQSHCVHDGQVSIGIGARASDPEALSGLPTNTVVRSVSVAIGNGADATDPLHPEKEQAIAIGNQSRASAVNAIAIGAGVRHDHEDDMSGGNAYASGAQSAAFGYSAKATALQSWQLGFGTNDTPTSLKFFDTFIVKDGKVQGGGTDTNTVARMIQAEADKGLMYGSTGATNGYNYIRLSGVNDNDRSDPELILAINSDTNSDYAASFPLYPGSPNRREVYSAQTVDRLLSEKEARIAALEEFVYSITNNVQ